MANSRYAARRSRRTSSWFARPSRHAGSSSRVEVALMRPLSGTFPGWALLLCVTSACAVRSSIDGPGASATAGATPPGVQHYVYFNVERQRIHEPWFLASRSFAGAQLKYRWRELEPSRDQYDFSAIHAD